MASPTPPKPRTELEKMKEIVELKKLRPVYTGKWSTTTDKEVQEELAKCYSKNGRYVTVLELTVTLCPAMLHHFTNCIYRGRDGG
ncbi:putative glutamyl-tRNA synthetase 1, 2 [Corchorus olitorius]|uniref:Glutamyl-tRNA synthetase 1, 2 n=1 Tax=Corchorus olitorius TaxID=93759 RepID=A0A1R3HG61_9ROSI|nr:putative glutamyl-tRNA synthetase 1, 2 [Corchorus olitorius]